LELDWHARADARDREAAKRMEREAIRRRVRVLDDQRKAGELMRRRGVEYLTQAKIESAADAVRAIKEGVALERSAEGMPGAGLPEFIFEMLVMSDVELHAELDRLHGRVEAGVRPALGSGAAEGAGGEEDGVIDAGDPVLSAPATAETGVIPGPDLS
jgi:hypothetical protein